MTGSSAQKWPSLTAKGFHWKKPCGSLCSTQPSFISVLRDPDVRIRFWAVFGLGGRGHRSARTVRALESMLGDREVPPGNWWSVGKEALAMLASMQPSVADYEARLIAETQRLLLDP